MIKRELYMNTRPPFLFFAALFFLFSLPLSANPAAICEKLWQRTLAKWDADKDGMLSISEWRGRTRVKYCLL